jgi:uncharacterized protein
MPEPPAPLDPESRIPALDAVRGVALLGVLWSNLNHYAPTAPTTAIDHACVWIQQWLIQNRFYSLLGVLFGIGFAIQLGRAETRGEGGNGLFYRRMLVLLLFGVLHGMLIWSGDILTKFALVGLLLPVYGRLSQRGLLLAGLGTLFGLAYVALLAKVAVVPGQLASLPDFTAVYVGGSYPEILPARVSEYLRQTYVIIVHFWSASAPFLTLFILGLWAARTGVLDRLRERRRSLRRGLWLSLGCVGLGLLSWARFDTWWPRPDLLSGAPGFDLPHLAAAWWLIFRQASTLLLQWGTAGVYGFGIALLAIHPRWQGALRPVAAVGRMSLTTYVTQSVLSTALFYGYGLGWYGRVSHGGMLGLTLAIFGVQLAFGTWWFRRYRFGPCEWLWRSLSYRRSLPLRLGGISGM